MRNSPTLGQRFVELADLAPETPALFIVGENEQETMITRRALVNTALAAAQALRAQGVGRGDIAVLKLPHGRALIELFLGATLLGAVPAILDWRWASAGCDSDLTQLADIAGEPDVRLIVTTTGLADRLHLGTTRIWTPPSEFSAMPAEGVMPTPATGSEPFYVQYTSGTSGVPKGAVLSHAAVQTCLQRCWHTLALGPQDKVVNWLPLSHDMGLFPGLVLPLCWGLPLVLMSPTRFLRRPGQLLEAIHRHRATFSLVTNSAYHLLASHVAEKDCAALDLGCLRHLGCGGEPIRWHSQELFLRKFSPCGLRAEALLNGYGMAETVMGTILGPGTASVQDRIMWVSSRALQNAGVAQPTQPDKADALPLVSCGAPWQADELRIVDEAGSELIERQVGEILLGGPCIFSGYHGRPDLTAAALHNGWLHTGDLGFVSDGRLYVCGRLKDLIIVNGENIHPEAVEAVVRAIPDLGLHGAVAFGVEDPQCGTERLVLVGERSADTDPATDGARELTVRRELMTKLGLTVGEVRFVQKAWIRTTPNGKAARAACRTRHLKETTHADVALSH